VCCSWVCDECVAIVGCAVLVGECLRYFVVILTNTVFGRFSARPVLRTCITENE
jgi:hypothetical protein